MYKFKIKSIILFERLMNKPFEIKTSEDIYVYFYCVRKVSDEANNETFEELLDKCDNDPSLVDEFLKQFAEHNKRQNALNNWTLEGFGSEQQATESQERNNQMLTEIVVSCPNFDRLLECTDYYMIDLYLQSSNLTYKSSWEQTRFLAYITAQVQSTKKLKPTDIIKFAWDNVEQRKNKTIAISEDKKNELIEKMKLLESKHNLT